MLGSRTAIIKKKLASEARIINSGYPLFILKTLSYVEQGSIIRCLNIKKDIINIELSELKSNLNPSILMEKLNNIKDNIDNLFIDDVFIVLENNSFDKSKSIYYGELILMNVNCEIFKVYINKEFNWMVDVPDDIDRDNKLKDNLKKYIEIKVKYPELIENNISIETIENRKNIFLLIKFLIILHIFSYIIISLILILYIKIL